MKDNNDVNNRIKSLLSCIDKKYSNKFRNLTYDETKSEVLNCESEKVYLVRLFINKKENVCCKLTYFSKTIYVKWYFENKNNILFHTEIPKTGEFDLKSEHDSTDNVWKFYYCRYGNQLKGKKLTINGKEFNVHGEVDFNFSMDKINEYKYIIKNDKKVATEKRELANELLDICSYYNYSLLNYSIMPSTGNLQATKGSIGKDRFDVFIWALYLYDKGTDLILNSQTTAQNLHELIGVLDAFRPMSQYYEIIYDISEPGLISSLIKSGEKRIDTTDRVLDYIVLAFRVWQTRNNNFDHNQCRELFYKLGGERVCFSFLPYLNRLENANHDIQRYINS